MTTLTFTITKVIEEFLVKYPYAALDGDVTIIADGATFLLNGISLLDFAHSIQQWLNLTTKTNVLFAFDYSPEESSENPVLQLAPLAASHFVLRSAWIENLISPIVGLNDVIACFQDFLLSLNAFLQREYSIAFADIPLFKQP